MARITPGAFRGEVALIQKFRAQRGTGQNFRRPSPGDPSRVSPVLRSGLRSACGQSRFHPILKPTGVAGLPAFGGQSLGDQSGATPRAAIKDEFLAGVLFEKGPPEFSCSLEITHRQQGGGSSDTSGGPLGRFPDIDEDGLSVPDQAGGINRSNADDIIGKTSRREACEQNEPGNGQKCAQGGAEVFAAGQGLFLAAAQQTPDVTVEV
jgi:hypothetical protein